MDSVSYLRGKNVLGSALKACCSNPRTGYFRDGFCRTDLTDRGSHTVCAIMTEKFLAFSVAQGNDLTTPHPEVGFPGLQPGDRWCLCAARWREAYEAGAAPPVELEACEESALKVVSLTALTEMQLQ